MYAMIDAKILAPLNSDSGILDAARVSFAKEASGFPADKNQGLLRFLKSHVHWSPFGHAREIFSFEISTYNLLWFFKRANLAGFNWVINGPRLFLAGSAWAFHENLGFLPPDVADEIRQFYYNSERYVLAAPILFREVNNVSAGLVKHIEPKDIREFEDLTSISFRIKAPIFIARQMVKHQVHMCWNEESRRYIDDDPEFFRPAVWRSRPADGKIKQGSSDVEAPISDTTARALDRYAEDSLLLYNRMIAEQVAPELARAVLPQSMMVNWIWTATVRAWRRVCDERLAPGAQKESQFLAKLIDAQMKVRVPNIWNSLTTEPRYIERG